MLCRDCFHWGAEAVGAARCSGCGGPRLLRHPALDRLTIAHIDCDAFYAAVEKRDDPSLAAKPVIVGGGGNRGVVATACYVARTYGVRSAMPMFKALKLCPQAVVIRPNMAKYAEVGLNIRTRMESLTPLVEAMSIDEAFLDLTGTEALHGAPAAAVLARFAAAIEKDFGLTVSIGLSDAKFLAKIASELDKPRGFAVLPKVDAPAFLADKPLTFLPGVGRGLAAKLEQAGFSRVGHLAGADPRRLVARFGKVAERLVAFARGEDARTVQPRGAAISLSTEDTFDADLADFETLDRELWLLCERLSARLKAKRIAGRTLHLKLKSADFVLRTRAQTLGDATQLAERLYRASRELLRREVDGTAFRLLGIGVCDLVPQSQGDLPDLLREANGKIVAERAVDAVRAKFGSAVITKGRGFGVSTRGRGGPRSS